MSFSDFIFTGSNISINYSFYVQRGGQQLVEEFVAHFSEYECPDVRNNVI